MQFFRMLFALALLYAAFGIGQTYVIGSRTFLQAWRIDELGALSEAFRWPVYFLRYELQGLGIVATLIIVMVLIAYWMTRRAF